MAQGQLQLDEQLYTGKINGVLADTLPFPLTRQLLERGQERYNIYCSPCHDRVGSGQGMSCAGAFVARRHFTSIAYARRPSGISST